ncbi:MAG: hypothetical protein FVQ81_17970 [Candidatus Glassbacteria bacterium]|nr:hypothetical protein [Candidatus Glassbacteria bacterium]
MKVQVWLLVSLLLAALACGSGDSGRVRPVDESDHDVPAAADTQPEQAPAEKPAARRPAQRAWDTSNPESFDVEELNRQRAKSLLPSPPPPPLKLDTLRVKPSEHPELPSTIIEWLDEREYIIPQSSFSNLGEYSNVIYGEFLRKGQQDCAVLVIKEGNRSLIVFPQGKTNDPHIVCEEEDSNFWAVYRTRPTTAVYLYKIEVVGKEYILERYRRYGGPMPPVITHAAINYIIVEKASSVFYYHIDNWIELQGAD